MLYLLVFAIMVVIDFAWTRYIKAAADSRRLAAASYSAAIIGLGAFNTWVFVHDPLLVLPEMAGAFVGTWASIALGAK